jgi:flavin-dependent dehydrogenase
MNICGLGISGSYLLRRLSDLGFQVKGYDPKRPGYYIPCGYATNENNMKEFCRQRNVEFEDYIVSRAENVIISGDNFPEQTFRGSGLCTFDKNRFELDLVKGMNYSTERFTGNSELSLDCSGISRALLGKTIDDYTMNAIEYLSENSGHDNFYFNFYRNGTGYFWEFPMGDKYHVGAGGIDQNENMRRLEGFQKILVTGRRIRLKPLFENICLPNVIGIGESIGCVSPITGEGIVPSLRSAEIFVECARKSEDFSELSANYSSRIIKEFARYEGLHRMVLSMQSGRVLTFNNLKYAMTALNEIRDFGIDVKARSILLHFAGFS